MYAISLYRYDVCIYSGSRRQIDCCPVDFAMFGIVFFTIVFAFWANYCNLFYDCSSLGEVFAHGGEFSLPILKVVVLGHGVENYCGPVTTVVTVL